MVRILRDGHPDPGAVAVVTHAGSGSSLLSAFLGVDPQRTDVYLGQANTGVAHLRVDAAGVALRSFNTLTHLGETQVTW